MNAGEASGWRQEPTKFVQFCACRKATNVIWRMHTFLCLPTALSLLYPLSRHGRACPGHPSCHTAATDGRDKPGDDAESNTGFIQGGSARAGVELAMTVGGHCARVVNRTANSQNSRPRSDVSPRPSAARSSPGGCP